MPKMLVVDDEVNLRALVRTYAETEGFSCREAKNGNQALEAAEEESFDIIILDIMMPGMDGFQTLAALRKTTETPVILLTARGEEYDRLLGFSLGADDYVPKPFSPKELMARVKAVLKRSRQGSEAGTQYGTLEILEKAHAIRVAGVEVEITPKEFDLLLYLSKNNHVALSREQILKNVWGYDYLGGVRTVDTLVKSLRERLGNERELIQTVWGVGYKFEYKE